MWMDGFFQARALSGLLASVTGRFRIDGLITVVPTVAGNSQALGLRGNPRQYSRSASSSFG
jgi:hypothetical protein